MKEWLNYALCRYPRVYERLVRLRGRVNTEKVLFLNLVRKGDVVFDLGANRGYYTLLFSHLAGEEGEVHAFEPLPPTFERLVETVAHGKRFLNVFLNNLAVADSGGIANLYMPNGDDGQASMRKHVSGSWDRAIDIKTFYCKVIKLDDYVESVTLKRLDFVKCDVEGAELLVLRGMARTLKKFAPILHLEVCLDWTKDFRYAPIDIVRYLSTLGYSRFYLVTDVIVALSEPYGELSRESSVGSANLLYTVPRLHGTRSDRLVAAYSFAKHRTV